MRTMQIFIAAADELNSELSELYDLIEQVNKHSRARGYELEAVDSHNAGFIKELQESDLCVALYCNHFGEFSQENLEDAYASLRAGNNPKKIYIYFKNTEYITEELRVFRDSFADKYGHFYCKFENVDTMRLNFLLQCENYMNLTAQESMFKVRNSKIEINGEVVANLQNLPFVQNNKNFQKLLQEIQEARMQALQEPENNDLWQKIQDLQEERGKREEAMLRMAQFITRLSNEATSARLAKAISQFEAGETDKVNEILNDDIIAQEIEDRKRKIDAAREEEVENLKGLKMNLQEWELKIKNIQTEMQAGWFEQVCGLYDKSVSAARGYIEEDELAKLLCNYGIFLYENKQYHLQGDLFAECEKIYRKLSIQYPNIYAFELAKSLNNLAISHCIYNKYDIAEKEYNECLEIYRRLAILDIEGYESEIARTLGNLARLHCNHKNYELRREEELQSLVSYYWKEKDSQIYKEYKSELNYLSELHNNIDKYKFAEKEYTECIKIYRRLSLQNPEGYESFLADALMGLAMLHGVLNSNDLAEKEYSESLRIYRRLAENNPNVYEPDIARVLCAFAHYHYERYHDTLMEKVRKDAYWRSQGRIENDDILSEYDESMEMYRILAEREYNECIEKYRCLAKKNPKVYEPKMAGTLCVLANYHYENYHYNLARQEYSESLEIYRRLAENNPKVYELEVARILKIMAGIHRKEYKYDLFEKEYLESLDIYRRLSERNPEIYDTEVANILIELSEWYSEYSDFFEDEEIQGEIMNIAGAAYNEAMETRKRMNENNTEAYKSSVALTLNNLAYLHYNQNKYALAENEYNKSLEIYRSLSIHSPEAFDPVVALALNNLATVHKDLDKSILAEDEYTESLKIYRRLTEQKNGEYYSEIADILLNLSELHKSQNKDLAEKEFNEAMEIYNLINEDDLGMAE